MFAFLGSGALGQLGEMLAPKASPAQELHQAIEDNFNEKAMRLIQEGVYFNSPDSSRDDALPIHTACKAGNRAMLDTMIEMGADINSKDRSGNLPLHAAAKAGKIELVKYLVSIGGDVARRNNCRQTPYDVATSHIVRQYLLPLQLRAEPEPAPGTLASVHNPDVIRDYSNLAPPPTFIIPGQYNIPPPSNTNVGAVPSYSMKSSGWTDPAVTRPIAADGFHCSVGNPELAAKYGHIKAQHKIAAPPPTLSAPTGGGGVPLEGGGQQQQQQVASSGPRPQANPAQYSAFAAYGGRPPPRYVTYNVANNTSQPFMNPNITNLGGGQGGAGSPVPPPPPYGPSPSSPLPIPGAGGQAPQHHLPPPQQQQLQASSYGQQQPQAYVASPPQVPLPSQPLYPTTQPYMGSGGGTPPIRPAAPSSASGIPTLPAPNTISVFQPLADNGDDAIELDGSVTKQA